MHRINLIGAVLLLALFGASSFAMWSDKNEDTYFDRFSWFPNKAPIFLKELSFFPISERSRYANEVCRFGESDPNDLEKYDELCNRFDEPYCGDDNYAERSNLFEFQEGIQEIGEIKRLHCKVIGSECNSRRLNSLIGRIKQRHKDGRMKLSFWALRFRKDDYREMQSALTFAMELALEAVRIKRVSQTKS